MREDFSSRLRKAIDNSPLKQTEIADFARITAPYLSDLKTGKKTNPSREVVGKLAECLKVSYSWLMLGGESSPEPDYQKLADTSTSLNNLKEDERPYGEDKWKALFESLIDSADSRWLLERVSELNAASISGDTKAKTLLDEILPRLTKRFPDNSYLKKS